MNRRSWRNRTAAARCRCWRLFMPGSWRFFVSGRKMDDCVGHGCRPDRRDGPGGMREGSCGCHRPLGLLVGSGAPGQRRQALRYADGDQSRHCRVVALSDRAQRHGVLDRDARRYRRAGCSRGPRASSSDRRHGSNLQVERSRGEMVREHCSGENVESEQRESVPAGRRPLRAPRTVTLDYLSTL